MPVYEYKGFDTSGKPVNGIRDAETVRSLKSALKKEGIFLTEVKESETRAISDRGEVSFRRTFARITAADIAVTTRQLSTLIGAGITLVESLTALVEQTENQRLKVILSQIRQKVNEGMSLADAMGEHPKVFSHLYVNMIRAGESSGALEVVLSRLADYTESQAKLKQKIIGTMAYPAIMLVVGVAILMAMFIFVIPKLTKIFEDINATLPIYTQMLIFFANTMRDFWYVVFGGVGGTVFLFFRWKNSKRGKPVWDRWALAFPVFGGLVRMLAISRFTRTLSTLLSSGVPLLTSLNIVKNILNNATLEKVIEETYDAVREGEPIANPLRRSGEFPPIVVHMVAIGEKSGQLEEMLMRVSESYETQVDNRIAALTSLLEPFMIVTMGGAVAFVVLSILMPILQINEYVQ
ncbi:MAG: type II secretion system inner membrane protein GspF [Myxococcota bacterium]